MSIPLHGIYRYSFGQAYFQRIALILEMLHLVRPLAAAGIFMMKRVVQFEFLMPNTCSFLQTAIVPIAM